VENKIFKNFMVKNATATSADLYFYGDICADYWDAWQDEDQYPEAIRSFLAEQEGKDLNIYINSGGGSVFAGLAIYSMLKRHGTKNKVKVHVDGLAASIASVIAFAGTEKPVIPANAFMMIHDPWTAACGNAKDLRKMADDLDIITTGIWAIYEEHLANGVTIDQIKELMKAETWLNGQQAAQYFDIEVGDPVEAVAAVGDYLAKAKHIPEGMKSEAQVAQERAAKEKAAQEEKKRDELKRLIIKNKL
jgi:ATP-dependent protease ClpP protease subunit